MEVLVMSHRSSALPQEEHAVSQHTLHTSGVTPRALPSEITLVSSRRGMRAQLVAANHRLATLRVDNAWPLMSLGQRLTLDGKHGGLGPVQFHVQVIHDRAPEADKKTRLVQARWVLITAVEKRAYLVRVLREVLGFDARIVTLSACGEDILGSHRKLLFEVDRQRVRLINVGESILPNPEKALEAATPSPHSPDAPLIKRTQPGIVISTT